MTAPQVYIVCQGEHAEGQDPEMVFSNIDGAREWVQRIYDVIPTAIGVGTWMASLDDCDEVWIRRMKVWDQ